MYVSGEDYAACFPAGSIPAERLTAALAAAEKDIDGLTYGRVAARGFEGLTVFQRDLVKRAVCEQAEFRQTYAELLASPFSSYSINGVAMQWGGAGVVERGGVKAPAHVLALLRQTGLAHLGLDGRWAR